MPEDKAKRAARQKAYNARPEQKKARAARNAARAKMLKAGKAKKGDGKDVDHVNGVGAGNGKKNLRVMSRKKNRGRNNNKGKQMGAFSKYAYQFEIPPRPPIGLKPRFICDEQRKVQVLEAMLRYSEARKHIPEEWLQELLELNYKGKQMYNGIIYKEELQSLAHGFLTSNYFDGEDRRGCKDDWIRFDPDELQELVDNLIDYIWNNNT